MKLKTRYIVLGVEKTHQVVVNGNIMNDELKFVWADRMCGILPVFETKKAAEKYAGKRFDLLAVKVEIK